MIERLAIRDAALRFELFTTVPEWFFADSLGLRFGYHEVDCDLGLVQRTALEEDVPATVAALDAMLPFHPRRLDEVAAQLDRLGCSAVLCDISPLGIAAARRVGLPVSLVENFTWDWIYRHHDGRTPALLRHADRLEEVFHRVDLRIQAEPTCQPQLTACQVGPVARRAREPAASVRRRLGIDPDERMVLVSMGGVRWNFAALDAVCDAKRVVFVVPGTGDVADRQGALLRLPYRGAIHHPDLVRASDLVIGKLGYSTVAEVAHYGRRFLFLRRPAFPESPVLEAYVRRLLPSALLDQPRFDRGEWSEPAAELLAAPARTTPTTTDGAAATADLLLARLLPPAG